VISTVIDLLCCQEEETLWDSNYMNQTS
jgi:hypothetical protein